MVSAKEKQARSEVVDFAAFTKAAKSIGGPGFMINIDNYWRQAVQAIQGNNSRLYKDEIKDLTLSRGDLYDKVMCVSAGVTDIVWRGLQAVTLALVTDLLPVRKPVTVGKQKYRYEEHDWKVSSTFFPYGEPQVEVFACKRNGCRSGYDGKKVQTRETEIPKGCNGL